MKRGINYAIIYTFQNNSQESDIQFIYIFAKSSETKIHVINISGRYTVSQMTSLPLCVRGWESRCFIEDGSGDMIGF
jgi:hypothetical protein